MIRIYSAGNMIDAQQVCDALIDSGLDATVTGGYLSGAAGELPVDSLISVWLTEPMHKGRARLVIDAIEAERRKPVVEVVCQQCAESVESSFSHCWNCGSVLPQAAESPVVRPSR